MREEEPVTAIAVPTHLDQKQCVNEKRENPEVENYVGLLLCHDKFIFAPFVSVVKKKDQIFPQDLILL